MSSKLMYLRTVIGVLSIRSFSSIEGRRGKAFQTRMVNGRGHRAVAQRTLHEARNPVADRGTLLLPRVEDRRSCLVNIAPIACATVSPWWRAVNASTTSGCEKV